MTAEKNKRSRLIAEHIFVSEAYILYSICAKLEEKTIITHTHTHGERAEKAFMKIAFFRRAIFHYDWTIKRNRFRSFNFIISLSRSLFCRNNKPGLYTSVIYVICKVLLRFREISI